MTVTTQIESLDRSVHATNTWIKAVTEATGIPDRHDAYKLLRATLHALRDRLPPIEAAQLAAQFPALVRGIYYEGWTPKGKPLKVRNRQQFLELVRADLHGGVQSDLENHVRAIFGVVGERVSRGEIEDVIAALPEDVGSLWPDPPGA